MLAHTQRRHWAVDCGLWTHSWHRWHAQHTAVGGRLSAACNTHSQRQGRQARSRRPRLRLRPRVLQLQLVSAGGRPCLNHTPRAPMVDRRNQHGRARAASWARGRGQCRHWPLSNLALLQALQVCKSSARQGSPRLAAMDWIAHGRRPPSDPQHIHIPVVVQESRPARWCSGASPERRSSRTPQGAPAPVLRRCDRRAASASTARAYWPARPRKAGDTSASIHSTPPLPLQAAGPLHTKDCSQPAFVCHRPWDTISPETIALAASSIRCPSEGAAKSVSTEIPYACITACCTGQRGRHEMMRTPPCQPQPRPLVHRRGNFASASSPQVQVQVQVQVPIHHCSSDSVVQLMMMCPHASQTRREIAAASIDGCQTPSPMPCLAAALLAHSPCCTRCTAVRKTTLSPPRICGAAAIGIRSSDTSIEPPNR
ncbi:hypothetical protein C7974DRAFT_376945 [Boeremia exigua]|uniref:uncharacterized protein n=1 Tax=Boeremia exigua TaxID=749465 RepID=UPI001E8DA369|nr:uncharacterized protein C7974DRAFT_376945 [Boeremia exigua]KAH6625432.1 hypothetical protein C7974DRAFT_376945 [Boeremia exigua]